MRSPLPILKPNGMLAPRFKRMEVEKMKVCGAYTAMAWIETERDGLECNIPAAVTHWNRSKAVELCRCKVCLKMRLEQHRMEQS